MGKVPGVIVELSSFPSQIPVRFLMSLKRYAEDRTPTGGFLQAVLENDLKESIGRGDSEALTYLNDIVMFIYNQLPSACWGSPEKVKAWLYPDKPKPIIEDFGDD